MAVRYPFQTFWLPKECRLDASGCIITLDVLGVGIPSMCYSGAVHTFSHMIHNNCKVLLERGQYCPKCVRKAGIDNTSTLSVPRPFHPHMWKSFTMEWWRQWTENAGTFGEREKVSKNNDVFSKVFNEVTYRLAKWSHEYYCYRASDAFLPDCIVLKQEKFDYIHTSNFIITPRSDMKRVI